MVQFPAHGVGYPPPVNHDHHGRRGSRLVGLIAVIAIAAFALLATTSNAPMPEVIVIAGALILIVLFLKALGRRGSGGGSVYPSTPHTHFHHHGGVRAYASPQPQVATALRAAPQSGFNQPLFEAPIDGGVYPQPPSYTSSFYHAHPVHQVPPPSAPVAGALRGSATPGPSQSMNVARF